MRTRPWNRGLLALLALAVALGAFAASASRGNSATTACGAPVVVKAVDGGKVAINQYIQDGMHFAPGTVHVKSGCKLTFEYDPSMAMGPPTDPHTLSIIPASELPKTLNDVNNCTKACSAALGHLKSPNPQTAGSPQNPIVHFVLHNGKPTTSMTLGAVGDSVALTPAKAHQHITVTVTAKPGTVLHFLCAVHPWMQGKIVVS